MGGTSYDRIHLAYLNEIGGIVIPMTKTFTMLISFSMASFALPGMSGFVIELTIFSRIIYYQPKIYFNAKNTNAKFLITIELSNELKWLFP